MSLNSSWKRSGLNHWLSNVYWLVVLFLSADFLVGAGVCLWLVARPVVYSMGDLSWGLQRPQRDFESQRWAKNPPGKEERKKREGTWSDTWSRTTVLGDVTWRTNSWTVSNTDFDCVVVNSASANDRGLAQWHSSNTMFALAMSSAPFDTFVTTTSTFRHCYIHRITLPQIYSTTTKVIWSKAESLLVSIRQVAAAICPGVLRISLPWGPPRTPCNTMCKRTPQVYLPIGI